MLVYAYCDILGFAQIHGKLIIIMQNLLGVGSNYEKMSLCSL